MKAPINIDYAIACDDVRQEITGKFFLIGVYAGNIVLSSLPANLRLSWWALAAPTIVGDYRVQFRVSGPNDSILASGEMLFSVSEAEPTAIVIPRLGLQIQSAGEITLQYREGAGKWKSVCKLDARLGSALPPTS